MNESKFEFEREVREAMTRNNTVTIVDTCVLVSKAFREFLESVFSSGDGHLEVAVFVSVVRELFKLAHGEGEPVSRDAKEALLFVQKYARFIKIVGKESDATFADVYFLSTLNSCILRKNLNFVTDDRGLTESLRDSFRSMSGAVQHKHSVTLINFKARRITTLSQNREEAKPQPQPPRPQFQPKPQPQPPQQPKTCNPIPRNLDVGRKTGTEMGTLRFPNPVLFIEDGRSLTLVERIGVGAHGRVYSTDDETLCVKVLNPFEKGLSNTFVRLEKLLSKHLEHPNVIFPDGLVFSADKKPVGFYMKRVPDSKSLHEVILDGTASFMERISFLHQLSDALSYLESNDIDFVDLRVDNVLISDGKIFLIDIDGAAHIAEPEINEKVANPLYDPPANVDKADSFSFSSFRFCLFSLHLILGRHPFLQEGRTIRQAIDARDLHSSEALDMFLRALSPELALSYEKVLRGQDGRLPSFSDWCRMFHSYLGDLERLFDDMPA